MACFCEGTDSCTCGFLCMPHEIQRPCWSWSLSPCLVHCPWITRLWSRCASFRFWKRPNSPVSGSWLGHPVCSLRPLRLGHRCVLSTAARGRWCTVRPAAALLSRSPGPAPAQWGCKPESLPRPRRACAFGAPLLLPTFPQVTHLSWTAPTSRPRSLPSHVYGRLPPAVPFALPCFRVLGHTFGRCSADSCWKKERTKATLLVRGAFCWVLPVFGNSSPCLLPSEHLPYTLFTSPSPLLKR